MQIVLKRVTLPLASLCTTLLFATALAAFAQDASLRTFPGSLHDPASTFTSGSRQKLGREVNTGYDENKPVISPDGRTIYFARKYALGNTGGRLDPQDIWFSTTTDGIHWSKSLNAGSRVNTTGADNLAGISADGLMMFFTQDRGRAGSFHFTSLEGIPESSLRGPAINNESPFLEATLSSNASVILFTAKSKENICYQREKDERDIYVVTRNQDGNWTKPVNLGPVVNSSGDEYSPFLAADDRTLYFATDGRPGLGDADIFMTRRIGDGWTTWTTPVNLGPTINSHGFDGYLTLPATGDQGFMVSRSNGESNDIIRVTIPPAFRPKETCTMDVSIFDAVTGDALEGFVHATTNGSLSLSHTIRSQHRFHLRLTNDEQYRIAVSAAGYFPQLTGSNQCARHHSDTSIFLMPLTADASYALRSLLFEEASAVMKTSDIPELDELLELMRMNHSMIIELSGHTDNRGDKKSLTALSRERVKTVKNYLVENGIASNRIHEKAFGSLRPVTSNDIEENRSKNRRVEFRIKKI
jgi:outer membrane protein OmpA-like peptidoglycan-associated protein